MNKWMKKWSVIGLTSIMALGAAPGFGLANSYEQELDQATSSGNLNIAGLYSGGMSLQNVDIGTALLAVQAERAKLLDSQLAEQIASVNKKNDEISRLNGLLQTLDPQSPEAVQIRREIDSYSSSQQMEMLRLQSMSSKRDEAFDVMTNFIKKMQDSRSSIIGNMR